MTVVTRFAPSPTGFLHIGGARTALFNWLFARHHGGTYRLRIEDTDRQRSTKEAVDAILDGLSWLGLEGDGEVVFQSARAARHAEVARTLLEQGKAYRCYCTPEELTEMRERARAEGRSVRYDGRWRDRDPSEAPAGVDPVIRIKAPLDGEMTIQDAVQGAVTVPHAQLDDMILLRADGTPTYMHSVVVDDHDMGVTHVIRGDDHLNNAFRQALIFQAMGWDLPVFAHLPLIHGPDGAKFSKRHGALGVDAYRDMGYLPEALRNYLLRLGWSHGDDEIISTEQAVAWFDLDKVGQSAARFDYARLESLNGHYIRETDDDRLAELVAERLADDPALTVDDEARRRLRAGMPGLKSRAKTLVELAANARFYVVDTPIPMEEKAAALLDDAGRAALAALAPHLTALTSFDEHGIEDAVRRFAEEYGLKLGKVAQPLRAAITGSAASPGIFEVLAVLGKAETLRRIEAVCAVHTNG
ncbi:glutamate--tRNA ligase [Thalassobaculum sp.]|uniref:glutamate--tRNA ligase n=1 Tax=Thalassobaculum sp. TaxID=2022740 RepID=UPI0032ED74DE